MTWVYAQNTVLNDWTGCIYLVASSMLRKIKTGYLWVMEVQVILIFLLYNFLCFPRDFPPKVSILGLKCMSILEVIVLGNALSETPPKRKSWALKFKDISSAIDEKSWTQARIEEKGTQKRFVCLFFSLDQQENILLMEKNIFFGFIKDRLERGLLLFYWNKHLKLFFSNLWK